MVSTFICHLVESETQTETNVTSGADYSKEETEVNRCDKSKNIFTFDFQK